MEKQFEAETASVEVEPTRYRSLRPAWRHFVAVLFAAGIAIAVHYNFGGSLGDWFWWDSHYFYLFIGVFVSAAFILIPASKRDRSIRWYDGVAAILVLAICVYFFSHGREIYEYHWWSLPWGTVLFILLLEGARRAGGWVFLVVVLIFAFYPVYSQYMPGVLWGPSTTISDLIRTMIFHQAALLGLLTKIVAVVLPGFLALAGLLVSTGAGRFFMDLALGVLGKTRGGPAKVAVLSSAFFGSLSGSAVSNVAATGSFTIPLMKQTGYPSKYAAAVEACASTGGVLMPPIMGAAAFVMAEILSMDYRYIIVAAAIPAILYYAGLILQIDGYAARVGLRPVPANQIPSLLSTLKKGWPFIVVIVFLVWGLLYMRWERLAPWYACGLMLLISFFNKETRPSRERLMGSLVSIGSLISRTAALVVPVGFIMAGLTMTGVSLSFTGGLVNLGGGNVIVTLLLGVGACYLMGMIGLLTPAYLFLAVTLAPAILHISDLNVLAVHLFIMYYAMLACITPPVATASFVAATMAGSGAMETSFLSMRLAVVIYFIPFFFVFNPSLVLQGTVVEALYLFIFCVAGIALIAGGFSGYLLGVGNVDGLVRVLLVLSGGLIAFPSSPTTVVGVILAVPAIATAKRQHLRRQTTYPP
jgi:TRAP transporter 4TM/12TM fusion protein